MREKVKYMSKKYIPEITVKEEKRYKWVLGDSVLMEILEINGKFVYLQLFKNQGSTDGFGSSIIDDVKGLHKALGEYLKKEV
jgi:hypothetical protein